MDFRLGGSKCATPQERALLGDGWSGRPREESLACKQAGPTSQGHTTGFLGTLVPRQRNHPRPTVAFEKRMRFNSAG